VATSGRRRHAEAAIFRPLILSLILAATGVGLAACSGGEEAPGDAMVCWREITDKAGHRHFEVISRNVANLDNCAAQVEGLYLQEGREVVGAYQGYFVFANDDSVSSSSSRASYGYPVFMPAQRDTIDAGLRKLMKENHGVAPKASDLDIGRQQ
jgi:hypothetical protein